MMRTITAVPISHTMPKTNTNTSAENSVLYNLFTTVVLNTPELVENSARQVLAHTVGDGEGNLISEDFKQYLRYEGAYSAIGGFAGFVVPQFFAIAGGAVGCMCAGGLASTPEQQVAAKALGATVGSMTFYFASPIIGLMTGGYMGSKMRAKASPK